ncbi:MAG TPA: molecular chaperone DnaJ [Cyanobacteria bacterium UBA11372]|nr:molecular chaperone DnaJ [Cyanobacteria bacterium UBA11372]
MSVQNPYEELGLTEDASFDEIKAARDRLIAESGGDRKRQEMLEAAYDAILMQRLRMRQEGKIKVPEGVRFPERLSAAPPSTPPTPVQQSPAWLQRLIDTPSTKDVLLPAGLFGGLAALSVLLRANSSILQLTLALGIGLSLYFLNRKENLFGRAILLTLSGLLVGLLLGGLFYSLLWAPITSIALSDEQFITLVTLILLWLVCSFLR